MTQTISNAKSRAARFATFVSLAFLLAGCGAPNAPKERSTPVSSAKAKWNAHPSNPIISAGDLREKGLWNDPHVLKLDDGTYVMYLTTSIEEPFKPPILPFRAVSKDGVAWKLDPQTPLLTTAGTPYVTLETPSVVRYKGKWHMYYMGVLPPGSVPASHVGHAISDDGVNWRHAPNGTKVAAATGKVEDWNGFLVSEPGAVMFRDKIYLYFAALGARPGLKPPQLMTIGLMTSADGENFDKPRRVLSQNEALFPPARGYAGYATVSGIVYKDKLHLFYNVVANERLSGSDVDQVALHHAYSDDGETKWREDAMPIYNREDFDWTEGGIISPSVIAENGKLRMWFAGHMPKLSFAKLAFNGWKGRQFGIGYTEAPLTSTLDAGQAK